MEKNAGMGLWAGGVGRPSLAAGCHQRILPGQQKPGSVKVGPAGQYSLPSGGCWLKLDTSFLSNLEFKEEAGQQNGNQGANMWVQIREKVFCVVGAVGGGGGVAGSLDLQYVEVSGEAWSSVLTPASVLG